MIRTKRIRALLLAAALLLIAYASARALARPAAPHPWTTWSAAQRQPLVFAHQGGEGIRPSNTMLAFDHAAALGADVLDADMHITQDGVLVLMHDETVDRTTDGSGAIRALTFAQIQALNAAHRFSTDGGSTFPFRAERAQAPTLEDLFQAYPGKRFGIEIKQAPPEIALPFCALIRKHSLQDKVLVSSFRQENMDAFRRACPEVATSATQNEATVFVILGMLRLEQVLSPAYQSLQVPERNSGIDVLTPRLIAAARNRNLLVQPWTINSETDLRRVAALGVDGINTDFPDRLLSILGR